MADRKLTDVALNEPGSTAPATPRRYRRAADRTATRLGRVILAYLALIVGIITLAPFHFEPRVMHGWSTVWTWSDLVLNVIMFLPFGFVYQRTRPRGAPVNWVRVTLLGLGMSGFIEGAQLFAPDRFTSMFDLATNTGGAVLGALMYRLLGRRVREDAAVQSLALELPLMGLVYLLVPLCWLIGFGSETPGRLYLMLIPGVITGTILGTVYAAYVRPAGGGVMWLVATGVAWVLVSYLPATRANVQVMSTGATLVLVAALLRSAYVLRPLPGDADLNRRFELPTLRLILPAFTLYLCLSALWPLGSAALPWQGVYALALPDALLSKAAVFRALEQVAAFTLVGYMGAEYHGRATQHRTQTAFRVVTWSLAASAMLQVTRGFQPDAGASASLFGLTLAASAFGIVLYERQRDHVQALLKRKPARPRLTLVTRTSRPDTPPALESDNVRRAG